MCGCWVRGIQVFERPQVDRRLWMHAELEITINL
jgi:hypothetical protein